MPQAEACATGILGQPRLGSDIMNAGTQVDLNWSDGNAAVDTAVVSGSGAGAGVPADAGYLTDEEILGIEPVGSAARAQHDVILSEAKNPSSIARDRYDARTQRDSSGRSGP